jgi:putative ABC transport system permease protein
VQAALGRTPRQLIGQGAIGAAAIAAVALAIAIPLGLVVFTELGDLVTSSVGIGPGFGRLPSWPTLGGLGAVTLAVCAALGAWAARGLTRVPVSQLLHYE